MISESAIHWWAQNNKVDGQIKRKGTVEAFGQNWDLDLTLKLEKTKPPDKEPEETGEREVIF